MERWNMRQRQVNGNSSSDATTGPIRLAAAGVRLVRKQADCIPSASIALSHTHIPVRAHMIIFRPVYNGWEASVAAASAFALPT